MSETKTFFRQRSLALVAGVMMAGGGLAAETIPAGGPAKVEVRQTDGRWQLYVNHQPFFIKGAGLEFGDQEKLAAAGGNSFRTWRVENGHETGLQVLERARKNGLYVTMGLDVSRERHGFDYSNPANVARQLADLKAQVLQLKDQPALLIWDIGNELNLNAHNPKVWDAVNDISKMIHQVDPNHPTTTSLAGIGKDLVSAIKSRAPDLDLLCFQSYADIVNLPRELRDSGWDGPYAVTEWGATGHWECGRTAWSAPIEDNSTVKAENYRQRYDLAIASDTKNCLGSYVFLWGQKQERTPTWYGMFLPSGEATETVDVMQYIWTGGWPKFRSPQLQGLWLDGKEARQNVHLMAGQKYQARVCAQSPGNARLTYVWEVMEESGAKTTGGDFETPPQSFPGLVSKGAAATAEVEAPAKPGAYRLFVYALDHYSHLTPDHSRHSTAGRAWASTLDHHGRAAYANLPFYVDAKTAAVAGQP